MKIAIPTNGGGLEDAVAPVFGRAPAFLIVDVDENGNVVNERIIQNPAMNAGGGAGPMAVQTLINEGVEAVVAPQVGPNALGAIQAAGIRLHQITPGTPVQEAIKAALSGETAAFPAAPVAPAQAGTAPAPAYGPYPTAPAYPAYGYGPGWGRGMGRGGGRGRGRGMGRGFGRGGRGWGAQLGYCPWTGQPNRRARWPYGRW